MKGKTKKSIAKRIRVTKNGKVLRRSMGLDHFRARQTSKSLRGKRGESYIHASDQKSILRESTKTGN